jgi:hypothetical protein
MKDLFGTILTPHYVTHPDWDYVVVIHAGIEFEAYDIMTANEIPTYDEGVRCYTNGNNEKLQGKRVISLDEYKSMEVER